MKLTSAPCGTHPPLTDYDFCSGCVADPTKRQVHSGAHPFFTIATMGQDEALYARTRAQLQSQSRLEVGPAAGVRHESVGCDSCRRVPLVGVRHRCLECPGEFPVLQSTIR